MLFIYYALELENTMPRPIKNGKNFEVSQSIVINGKENNYHMAAMCACTDHYEMGFLLSGDHHTYSTNGEWDMHSGYVGTIPLGLLHQTFSTSDVTRNTIIIKFSFSVAEYIKSEISSATFAKFYNDRFHILSARDQRFVQSLFEQMLTEYNTISDYTEKKLTSLLTYTIIYIIEHELSKDYSFENTSRISKDINEVIRFIDSNYQDDISVDSICKMYGFSPAHFSRTFNKNVGEPFSTYLAKVRFEHAVVLLTHTDKSIDIIAYECGFRSISYFSSAFKKEYGMSPTKYRAKAVGK